MKKSAVEPVIPASKTLEDAAYEGREWPYVRSLDQNYIFPPPAFERVIQKLVRGRHTYVAIYVSLINVELFKSEGGPTFVSHLSDESALELASFLLNERNRLSGIVDDDESRMAVFDRNANFSDRARHTRDCMLVLDVPEFIFDGIRQSLSTGTAADTKAALARIADSRNFILMCWSSIKEAAAKIDEALMTGDCTALKQDFSLGDIPGYALRREIQDAQREVHDFRSPLAEQTDEETEEESEEEQVEEPDEEQEAEPDDEDIEFSTDDTGHERAAHRRMLEALDEAKQERERLRDEQLRERKARTAARDTENEANRRRDKAEREARSAAAEARIRERDMERAREDRARREETRRREEEQRRSRKSKHKHYNVEALSAGTFSGRGGSNDEGSAVKTALALSRTMMAGRRQFAAVRVVDQDGNVVFSC